MRTLVHVSDIHFGKFDDSCLEPMLEAFRAIAPDLIVISGDLTQRARRKEYEQAKSLLANLNHPYFVIPGNHDVRPIYSPLRRLFNPFDRYKSYISGTLEPVYTDKNLVIAAMDTVRRTKLAAGKVNLGQIRRICDWFKDSRRKFPDALRIIVTHHPLNLPLDYPKQKLAGRAKAAIHRLADTGIDMYLSGHYHMSAASHSAERHKVEDYSAIFIQAGTVSKRQRNEVQSFNVIKIEKPAIHVETYIWNPEKRVFELGSVKTFMGKRGAWKENIDYVSA
jgi:3',5'-cyclic AMP phosphodiesterase CpdA